MLPELSLIASKWKLFIGSVVAIGAFLADISVEPKSIEDYTFKTALLVAVVYLVRQSAAERESHATERKEHSEKVIAALDKNTECVAQQSKYFETIASRIIDDAMNKPKQ